MRVVKPQTALGAEHGLPEAHAHQLEQVLERTGEAVIIKDLNAIVTYWNREAEALYGFSAQEAVGQSLRQLHAAHLSAAQYAAILERIRAGVPTSSTADRRTRRGGVIRVSIKTAPLLDIMGTMIGEITIARDITEMHRTEEALRSAQTTLNAKMTAIRRNNQALASNVQQLESFHRDGEVLSRMTELLQACTQRAEAYAVVRETGARLFPNSAGALFIYRESRDLLENASTWGGGRTPHETLVPEECWALRLGNPHFVSRGGAVRCRHVPEEIESYVCMPVQGQGQVLGLLHIEVSINPGTLRPPIAVERRLHAFSDQVGPALANLKLRDALREMALRDGLTGLYNRRYLEDALARELHRAARSGKPVSVVMVDIDHFKQFNDKFGHDAGDFVLSAIARVISSGIRPSDIACRYGGEELTIVLPEADLDCACVRVEQLRLAIRNTDLTHRGQLLTAPTASFGIAVFPTHGLKTMDLLKAADKALFRAKKNGRDRICRADEEASPET